MALENLIDHVGNFSSSLQTIGLVFSKNDNDYLVESMKLFKSLISGLKLTSFTPKKRKYQDSSAHVESIKKRLDNLKEPVRNDEEKLLDNQLLIQSTGRFATNSLKNIINVEKEGRKTIHNRSYNVLSNIENILSLPREDPERTKQIDSLKISLGIMFMSEDMVNIPKAELYKLRDDIRVLSRAADTDILYKENNATDNAKRIYSSISEVSNVLAKAPIVLELQVSSLTNQESEILSYQFLFQPKLIEIINENIEKIGKIHDSIIASNNQEQRKESLQNFLDVSNRYILNILLTLEGLETGN